MSIDFRKVLLTMCRVQQSSTINQRIRALCTPHVKTKLSIYDSSSGEQRTVSGYSIFVIQDGFAESPLHCSVISMLLRCIPYISLDSAKMELDKGLRKEIQACLGEDRPQVFDYSPFYFRLGLPYTGGLPPFPEPYLRNLLVAIPMADELSFENHWIDVLFWYDEKEFITMPVMNVFDYDAPKFRLTDEFMDEPFEANTFPGSHLLEQLGYIVSEPLSESVKVDEVSRLRYRRFLKGELSAKYRFTVVRTLPSWWADVETWDV